MTGRRGDFAGLQFRPPWPDVTGPIETSRTWNSLLQAYELRFCQRLPGRRGDLHVAVTVPAETMEDAAVIDPVMAMAEGFFRPWASPDPCPVPELVLFPRLRRFERWVAHRRLERRWKASVKRGDRPEVLP